ncbi:hypothetical protein HDA44_004373 [Kribbella solani]|uniref:Uncharacterized protein n=1 Tax=Kribbella solani TaxID=236067 RepID=A0A841DR28_9ACTN|nr:hypothetical protein [Kribbella solani]
MQGCPLEYSGGNPVIEGASLDQLQVQPRLDGTRSDGLHAALGLPAPGRGPANHSVSGTCPPKSAAVHAQPLPDSAGHPRTLALDLLTAHPGRAHNRPAHTRLRCAPRPARTRLRGVPACAAYSPALRTRLRCVLACAAYSPALRTRPAGASVQLCLGTRLLPVRAIWPVRCYIQANPQCPARPSRQAWPALPAGCTPPRPSRRGRRAAIPGRVRRACCPCVVGRVAGSAPRSTPSVLLVPEVRVASRLDELPRCATSALD